MTISILEKGIYILVLVHERVEEIDLDPKWET